MERYKKNLIGQEVDENDRLSIVGDWNSVTRVKGLQPLIGVFEHRKTNKNKKRDSLSSLKAKVQFLYCFNYHYFTLSNVH